MALMIIVMVILMRVVFVIRIAQKVHGHALNGIQKNAQNLVIDHQRKKKIRRIFSTNVEDSLIVKDDKDVELKTHIKIAIQKMPEKIRTVFILHHIKKYKYKEIAEMCNISKKTVEKRMKKAILLLQKLLTIF